jgi:hypothetical protein
MVCLFPQARGDLCAVASPAGIQGLLHVRKIFVDQCPLIGLHVELMALAPAFGPFPARPTQCSDCQITLRRMQSQSAVNVPAAGCSLIESADEGRGVA